MAATHFQTLNIFAYRNSIQEAADYAASMNSGAATTAAMVMYNTMALLANERIAELEAQVAALQERAA